MRSVLARLVALKGAAAYTPHGLARPHVSKRIRQLRRERLLRAASPIAAVLVLLGIVGLFIAQAHGVEQ